MEVQPDLQPVMALRGYTAIQRPLFPLAIPEELQRQPGKFAAALAHEIRNPLTTINLATDMLESMERNLVSGNNYNLLIQAESEAEVDKLFNALSAGGTVKVPLNKTFWGAYFGMFEDKFGIQWMINYEYPKTEK